jgi:peroxiredoxin
MRVTAVNKVILGSILACGVVICALYGATYATDPFAQVEVLKPKVRMEAPAFTLMDINGGRRSISDFRGKIVLLNFWATWCPNCREEMPSLEKLHEQFKAKGVVVIAVAEDSRSEVTSFARKLGLTFPILLDSGGSVRKSYEVTALPMTYIIGRDGKISGRLFGGRDWAGADAGALIRYLLQTQ